MTGFEKRTVRSFATALLATLVVVAAVPLAMADTTPAGYHGAVGRNLILNPDFELGAGSWLHVATWTRELKTFTNPEKQPSSILPQGGMDGGDCLRLGSFPVRSYSFPAQQGKQYTVSMYLKAPEGVSSADIAVLMIEMDWQVPLWEKMGGIGKEWKQYTWTFNWDRPCKQGKAYLNIASGTGVLVDRVLVTEGSDPTYEAPVMMGLVGNRHPYFIRGRDEAKMSIRVAPGNMFTGEAHVTAVARDGWKKEAWTKEFDVSLDKVTQIPIALPTDTLGNFHVEFTATQDGKVIGRGVSRYAIMDPPAKAPTAPGKPSPFGICQSIFAWPSWANARYADILVDTGPQFNRFFAKAPRDLPYPFPKAFLDRQISLVKPAHEAGIDLMGCIQFFPGSFQCGKTAAMPTDAELAAYRRGVKAYVTALSPYIKYWEIFNEPDLWRDASGKHRAFSPEKYLLIQKTAYEAIKEVDPKLTVVANALNTFRWNWMESWWKAGGTKYMEYFSFHPYRSHPDQLNEIGVYKDMMRARAMLDKFGGKDIGMINSEQLYGCNLFYDRQNSSEIHRGYYVDTNHELEAASRQARNLIHHVAAGATCCPFTFREEFAYLGPENSLLIYDSVPTYNATTRFLAHAGRGEPINMGEAMRTFIFPDAKDGVLLAVWTPTPDVRAAMKLDGDYEAFDMMGNPRPEMVKAHTLEFGTDPVWVRFKGATAVAVRQAVKNSSIRGVSDPIRLAVAITGENELSVYVKSLTNQPLSGEIALTALPESWTAKTTSKSFNALAAGGTTAVTFTFNAMPLDSDKTFDVTAKATLNGETYTKAQSLRPFHAVQLADRIKADGNAGDWDENAFTTLSDENLSTNFNAALGRQGDADLSAKVAVAWSKDKLAFIAIVTDDHYKVEKRVDHAYLGDSIQLYFDQLNDATDADGNTADDISYTLTMDGNKPVAWINDGAEGNYKGAANQQEGLADPEAEIAIRREGKTTIYELVLPRAACLPNVELKPGGGFGFSLLINDNDGKGRKVGLTLAPKGSEPYQKPQEYRDLILQNSADSDNQASAPTR